MRRPLAVFGLTFMAAQWLAACLPPVACLLPAAFLVYLFLAQKRGIRYAGEAAAFVIAAAAVSGFLFHHAFVLVRVVPALRWEGQTVPITAVVESSEAAYAEGASRCVLTVTQADGKRAHFKVQADSMPDVRPGNIITGQFRFESLEGSDYETSRYADGIFLSAEYESEFACTEESSALRFDMLRLRNKISFLAGRHLSDPYSSIASAIVTGDKSNLTDGTEKVFRRAGVSHLLVVSGLHLTLLCSFVRGLFPGDIKYCRLRAAGSALFTLLAMSITGFTPSICRAGAAMLLFCLGEFLLAPTDSFTSLGFAALVLCLANGYAACDIGFQLSVLATAGVLLAEEVTARREDNDNLPDWTNDLIEMLANFLLPSLLAALATLPIQLVHGLSVSGVSVFANIATLWLIQPILAFGVLIAICGLVPILQYSAMIFSMAEEWLLRLLWSILEFFAGLPAASLNPPVRFTLFLLLVWAAAALLSYLRQDKRLFASLTAVVIVLGCASSTLLGHGVVRAALVGNASTPAVVITQDKSACVLFRGGRYNQRKVEDYLEAKGINTADLWILMSQGESSVDWEGKPVLCLEELPQNQVEELAFGSCCLSLLNQAEGNLVLTEVDGFTFAAAAGKVTLPQKIKADVYLGGAASPAFAEIDRYLVSSRSYTWLAQTEEDTVVYSRNTPYVEIRPGRSAEIWKGEKPFG